MGSFKLQMGRRGAIAIPKALREACGLEPGDIVTLIDLDGVFVIIPHRSDIDEIADRIAEQWTEEEETLESMLEALREERER